MQEKKVATPSVKMSFKEKREYDGLEIEIEKLNKVWHTRPN